MQNFNQCLHILLHLWLWCLTPLQGWSFKFNIFWHSLLPYPIPYLITLPPKCYTLIKLSSGFPLKIPLTLLLYNKTSFYSHHMATSSLLYTSHLEKPQASLTCSLPLHIFITCAVFQEAYDRVGKIMLFLITMLVLLSKLLPCNCLPSTVLSLISFSKLSSLQRNIS